MFKQPFTINIKDKAQGRQVVRVLHSYTKIRVHGKKLDRAWKDFEQQFSNRHIHYNVRGNSLIGSGISYSLYSNVILAEDIIAMDTILGRILWGYSEI